MWNIILGMLGAVVWPLVKRILVALGVGFVAYQGYDALFGQIKTQIETRLGQLSADLYALVALGGGITAINVILSAFSIKLILLGLNAAGGYKPVWRKPGTWPGSQPF